MEKILSERVSELARWTADYLDDIASSYFYATDGQAATVMDDSSDRMESYIQNLQISDPIREALRETDPPEDAKKP